jgi:hypothetical protein
VWSEWRRKKRVVVLLLRPFCSVGFNLLRWRGRATGVVVLLDSGRV